MATRNISDCIPLLTVAYNKACAQWVEQHSDKSTPFVTCAYRSKDEQQATYNQGRTKPGAIVTWALPGQSAHNYLPSLAFDIAFKSVDGTLDWDSNLFNLFFQIISEIEPSIEWGGNFPTGKKDLPHFEIKNWTEFIQK